MASVRSWAQGALCAVLLGAAACASPAPPGAAPPRPAPAAPEPLTLRQATQTTATGIALWLAAARGYLQQEGLDIEYVTFSSASEMIPALATGQLDISPMPANPAMWNAVARGVPARIVVDVSTYRPTQGDQALAVRKAVYDAGRGHRLEDLRTLSLAITPPGKATTSACALSVALQKIGMSLDDLHIEPIPFPEMVAAFANGAIDAALIVEPFLTRAISQGTAVRIMGLGEMYPNFTIASLGFTEALYQNRPIAKGYVRAYIRGTRDYLDAIDGRAGDAAREEVYQLIARGTNIDLDTVRAMTPPFINPNGLPNRESMLHCYQFFRDQGLIPQPVPDTTFQTLWGTDLVDEVLAEIGRVPDN